jgi:hypothetical protein
VYFAIHEIRYNEEVHKASEMLEEWAGMRRSKPRRQKKNIEPAIQHSTLTDLE